MANQGNDDESNKGIPNSFLMILLLALVGLLLVKSFVSGQTVKVSDSDEVEHLVNLDLLQSEKNLYSAERNLANAKYDYILANLRLGLSAGNLEPENIADINNFLN